MADERLRLVAEVQDQFTGPLDKLNTALRHTASAGSKTAKDIAKDFEGFHGTLGKATSTLQGMLSPLQSLGVAGLGAGLGLSGIATALRSFSSGTQQLSILSKESGLAVNQLRALSQLGDRFGVSAETMNSGVIHLSEGMRKLKMGYGELQTSLLALDKGEFAKKLFNAKDMQDALDTAMEELSKEKDSYKRRQLAEVIFGTKDFGVIAGQVAGKYREVMQEIIASQGVMTKETEKAAAEFEKNMSRMGSAAERLKLNTLGPLLKGLNTIVESGDRAGIRGNAEAMDKDLNTRLGDATKRRDELAKDPTKNADAIKSLEKEIRTLTDAIRRSKDGAGPSGVSAIPMSFSGGPADGGARIYNASLGGGGFGGANAATLGGFGGPLPTLGGGYGGNPNVTGGGSGRGYGGSSDGAPRISPNAPTPALGRPGGWVEGPLAHRYPDGLAAGIKQSAKDLGVSAEDLATVISYETAGTFNPWKRGPTTKWGTHRGLIQWGEPQAKKYGVTADMTPGEQMKAVTRYLRDHGVRPGMGIHQIYGAINAGGVSERHLRMRDQAAGGAPGTVREKVDYQMGPHRKKGIALLDADHSGAEDTSVQIAGAGERSGDAVMRRFYGDEAPVARGPARGSLDITLHGFPAGTKPRASMDDLFKDVTVSKSRQMNTESI